MKLGDKVRVVSPGQTFTTYDVWAKHHNLKYWKSGEQHDKDVEGYICAQGPHLSHEGKILIAVFANGKEVIISEGGVVLVEPSSSTFSTVHIDF